MTPTASVLIPHHRNLDHLIPLFTSLLDMRLGDLTVEFVLVDNGSSDGSVELVREQFPSVRIMRMNQNLGFAPALNRAARQLRSEWIAFLNNDMRVERDWLASLISTARALNAPCASSLILDWSGDRIQFAGGEINWFGKGFEANVLDSPKPKPIFFPCGGAMAVRRDVLESIGGFDDGYFMIYEDVDLGWRLRLLGHEIFLAPDSKVFHRGHASLRSEQYERKAVYLERNSLATVYKNLDADSLAAIFPLALRETNLRARALSGNGLGFSYSPDGLATRKGAQAFFRERERFQKEREAIQASRIVGDQEIFRAFFLQPERIWAYCDEHYRRVHHPNSKPKIEQCFESVGDWLSRNG